MDGKVNILTIKEPHKSTLEAFGARLYPLEPIGAIVQGIDLALAQPPPEEVIHALEQIMAQCGFLVFKSKEPLSENQFLQASCW